MKKQILTVAGIGLLSTALLISSCAKEDTTAPSITLKGDASITLFTGEAYTDPGITATDDEDGDVSSKVVTTGTVDVTKAGEYTVKYNVSDAAGNAATEVKRTVTVKHKNATIVGSYGVSESCNVSGAGSYAAAITAGSGSTVDFSITNFGNYGITVAGAVGGTTGQTITIASQVVSGATISGSGTINPAGNVVTVTYTISDGVDSETCTKTMTKN